jgi:hypothetical protein
MGSRAIALGGLTALILMAFGTGVGLAADYQDAKHNVCEGNRVLAEGCPLWGTHVTGESNVALGDGMMNQLTSGSNNVALDFVALRENTAGSNNLASGTEALRDNTTGSSNIASGFQALKANITGNNNIASGSAALFSNKTGNGNIASGTAALLSNTTGSNNLASGTNALGNNKTGSDNIASGSEALRSNTEGIGNVASGREALKANTTGNFNIASGFEALENTTGSSNVALGFDAGFSLTTGSNNIDISNVGVTGESGTTRVGTEGTQTKAYVAGVYEKPVTTPACAVKVNSEGQLGCSKEGGGGTGAAAIATFASNQNVPSGQCLNSSEDEAGGSCPKKANRFPISNLLSGPIPANGATVTNLYAETNATVSGKDAVLVDAIDNTTGTSLLSCVVIAATKNHCSNTGSSVPVAVGDRIEVKITASGPSGNNKQWQVTFRY